jgi:nucleotide-binding universal stress UspA family protein
VVGSGSVTESASDINLEHQVRLRQWIEPLGLPPWRLSLHVIEALSPEGALLDFARSNHVDLILIGAPSPAQQKLAWWRSVASSVTANARCSVLVVRVPEPESDQEQGNADR